MAWTTEDYLAVFCIFLSKYFVLFSRAKFEDFLFEDFKFLIVKLFVDFRNFIDIAISFIIIYL